MLVLGTTGDPTTPVAAARRAVEGLEHAVLLMLFEDHHLAYYPAVHDPERPAYRCVLDAVEAYLIDLELPPRDTVCAEARP
ncbi:hypothetical protein BH24CHL9_BH24CHL9_11690 [soil metagenome]